MTSQTSHLNDHRGWQQITTFQVSYFNLFPESGPAHCSDHSAGPATPMLLNMDPRRVDLGVSHTP